MKRYHRSFLGLMEQSNTGEWVKYDEAKKLLDESIVNTDVAIEQRDYYQRTYNATFNELCTLGNKTLAYLSAAITFLITACIYAGLYYFK